jgi:hypothetical protein
MQQPVDGAMMDNLLGAPAPSTSLNNLGKIILSSDFKDILPMLTCCSDFILQPLQVIKMKSRL